MSTQKKLMSVSPRVFDKAFTHTFPLGVTALQSINAGQMKGETAFHHRFEWPQDSVEVLKSN